jgi:hypothetical protein
MNEALWAVFLWLFGLFIGSAAHEAGHLLCARIASIPIRQLAIGCGPILARGRIGALQLELRMVPIGGFVMPAALTMLQKRWQAALYFLGGVLGNIAMIGVIVGLHAAGVVPKVLDDAEVPLFIKQAGILVDAQLFLIIVSLIPHWGRVNGVAIGSDGQQLLNLIRGTTNAMTVLVRYHVGKSRPRRPSPAFPRIARALARTDRWTNSDARREVRDALRHELAHGDLPPAEEMLVLDALITDVLLFADPGLRPELDQWSLRALQLGPKLATLIGSRGSALVELGLYQEGKALLEPLAFADTAAPFDLLMSRIFLARAEHALGNATAAADLMRQAQATTDTAGALAPGVSALIGRIEGEMQTMP